MKAYHEDQMRKYQEARAKEWEKLRKIAEDELPALYVPNSLDDEVTNKEVGSTSKLVDDICLVEQEKKNISRGKCFN